ncbi:hypothetical protein [Streptomyces sp. NPDC093589]|uniref:hypothetical protein n=1 Tax=Streptomyces sp. NPDC093589 TaxID=3366043 RepID=UPI00381FDBF2
MRTNAEAVPGPTLDLLIRGLALADESEHLYPLIGSQGSTEARLNHHEKRADFYREAAAAGFPETAAELDHNENVIAQLRAEVGWPGSPSAN